MPSATIATSNQMGSAFNGRAYKKPLNGKPSMQRFYAATESELTCLIDEFHGVVGRAYSTEPAAPATALLPPLDLVIPQFWEHLWLEYSNHDGPAVCAELYHMWPMFLSQRQLAHLVHVTEKDAAL